MKELNKNHKRSYAFKVLPLLVLLLLQPMIGSAVASPNQCLAYAYTKSGNHYFLMANNSSNFGDNLTIITNCEYIEISIEGEFYANITRNTEIYIEPGKYNLTFENENFTRTYSNVVFYPNYLTWEANYLDMVRSLEPPNMIEEGLFETRLNWAVFFGIIVVWVLCVYVYWNLINTFVQRNFIEEVTQ